MIRLIIFSAILLFAISCNKQEDRVLLRERNVSTEDFKNVRLYQQSMGDVDAGKETGYKEFEMAYRIAYVQLELKGVTVSLIPIDFVGETPLENGKYTFEIGVNPLAQSVYDQITLQLVED